jgi:hypothetical protein
MHRPPGTRNVPAMTQGVLPALVAAMSVAVLLLAATEPAAVRDTPSLLPADHRELASPTSYDQMAAFLKQVEQPGFITVSEETRTAKGRSVFLVHLGRGGNAARWRVLFYAQQHGDEPSGKDALLFMIRDIAANNKLLAKEVDLWIMPMVNPDGAEAKERRNANGADLNRDHILLAQAESEALHRVCKRVLPHVAVDCHEFDRDSADYRERGWNRWPIITMDGLNNPLFDPALVRAGVRWVNDVGPALAKVGHNFARYSVGGVPPDEEQRFSTPGLDDGRNGLGAYGGLSFIIEAGVMQTAADPNADLGRRVDACLTLLWQFINDDRHRADDIRTIERARRAPLPAFVATNYFWANVGAQLTEVPVIDVHTGRNASVLTPNFMRDLVVKRSVPAPRAYVIDAAAAASFRSVLERHAIAFTTLGGTRLLVAERCRLERVEDGIDELYGRYAGRQIVSRDKAGPHEFAPGALLVRLDQPAAVRAALVLEPSMLYGLYQYKEFRALVGADQVVPVWRVTGDL